MKEALDIAIFQSQVSRKNNPILIHTLFEQLDAQGHHMVATGSIDRTFDHSSLIAPTEQLLKQKNPLAIVIAGDSLLASILTTARMIDKQALRKVSILYVPIGKHSYDKRSYGVDANTDTIMAVLNQRKFRSVPRADIIYTHDNGEEDIATALVAAGGVTEGGKHAQYKLQPQKHKSAPFPTRVETYNITTPTGKDLYTGQALMVETLPGNRSANVDIDSDFEDNLLTIAVLPADTESVQTGNLMTWREHEVIISVTPAIRCHYDGQKTVDHIIYSQPRNRIVSQSRELDAVVQTRVTGGNNVIFCVAN